VNLLAGVNAFELLMIRSSALLFLSAISPQAADMLLPELNYPNKDHRDRVLFALDALEELSSTPGPKFVFAHIVSPHEPMVFGPNGETLEREPSYDRDIQIKSPILTSASSPSWMPSCKTRPSPDHHHPGRSWSSPERGRVRKIRNIECLLFARWRRPGALHTASRR